MPHNIHQKYVRQGDGGKDEGGNEEGGDREKVKSRGGGGGQLRGAFPRGGEGGDRHRKELDGEKEKECNEGERRGQKKGGGRGDARFKGQNAVVPYSVEMDRGGSVFFSSAVPLQ